MTGVTYHHSGTHDFDDVSSGSVTTGSVVDSDDDSAWETLREIGFEGGDVLPVGQMMKEDATNVSTTNTSFTAVDSGIGVVDLSDLPSSATRWKYIVFQENNTSNETTTTRPRVRTETDGATALGDLALATDGTGFEYHSTGWTEISTSLSREIVHLREIQMKVTGGTGQISGVRCAVLVGVKI